VKELKDGINKFNPSPADTNLNTQLVVSAKQMYQDLDSKGESFPPYAFVQTLRMVHPTFDETDNQGRHLQQDSEECFNIITQAFKNANMKIEIAGEEKNLVSHLFDIDLEVTYTNTQSEEEEKTVTHEKQNKLFCHIDNQSKPVNHLIDGLSVSLIGEQEKFSEVTQSNCIYRKEQKINNLPPYLVVNMVRFFWKKESVTAGTKAGKSKILRNVSFPMVLDVYDLCSDTLKESLNHGRKFEAKLREEYDEKMLTGKTIDDKMDVDKPVEAAKTEDVNMEEEKVEKPEEEKKEAGSATTKKPKVKEASIKDHIVYRDHGVGLDTGKYQLLGVVTHKGRTADGGHYIGWIHSTEDEWYE